MFDSGNIYVVLEGVDMQLEAWGLIRLFIDEDRIVFTDVSCTRDITKGSMLITLSHRMEASSKHIEACLFERINDTTDISDALSRKTKPVLTEYEEILSEDLTGQGGALFNSIKILCGTTLYRLLSKKFNKTLPYGSLLGVRPVKLASRCLDNGLNEEDTVSLLEKVTAMSEKKARTLIQVASFERSHACGDENKINVYIGIPFCLSRCLYCSFASHPIGRMTNVVRPYLDALIKEMESGLAIIRKQRFIINAVYLGGGTPTSLQQSDLSRLLYAIRDIFLDGSNEFTVEAGRPDTIDREKLLLIKDSGATRISINPQSMNEETLVLIGRNHTPGDIVDAFRLSRRLGFDNINMDIIAGLPGETAGIFENTLKQLEILRPDSMTVHTMSVKRASKLRSDRESYKLTDDAVVEKMIEAADLSARNMGMAPYYLYRQKNILANLENTGYALPGKECDYNIQTMAEKQGIMAFGAGAISKAVFTGRDIIRRDDNVKDVPLYIDKIDEMIARKVKLFGDA